MGEKLNVNRVNGEVRGELTVADFVAQPRQAQTAKITLKNAAGTEASIDLAKVTSLNLLGATTIADSTAVDVAGLVVDFNALLAALRLAEVIV